MCPFSVARDSVASAFSGLSARSAESLWGSCFGHASYQAEATTGVRLKPAVLDGRPKIHQLKLVAKTRAESLSRQFGAGASA